MAARSSFRGTQMGSIGSYPPSGKVLSATCLAIYRLERGRIAKHGRNGTTCMGCNNSAITMQRDLLMGGILSSRTG